MVAELEQINKMLKDKSLPEKMRKDLEKKREILLTQKEVLK